MSLIGSAKLQGCCVSFHNIKALVFDTFGTVVDWRTSIIRQLSELGTRKGMQADWEAFADAWRAGYHPAMDRVRRGERPFASIDVLHRERLDEVLDLFKISGLSEGEKQGLNKAWHRLDPWPDSVGGLQRLKPRYILSTFSNGSFACLVNMAKYAGLPWDCIFCADIVRHFKPDPETYRGVIDFLGLSPNEVMLVAAHNYDHRHARLHGMRTAYVNRPTEFGPRQTEDIKAEDDWDVIVNSFTALADVLLIEGASRAGVRL
jgi:2-haloacid dehalogenase